MFEATGNPAHHIFRELAEDALRKHLLEEVFGARELRILGGAELFLQFSHVSRDGRLFAPNFRFSLLGRRRHSSRSTLSCLRVFSVEFEHTSQVEARARNRLHSLQVLEIDRLFFCVLLASACLRVYSLRSLSLLVSFVLQSQGLQC